VTALLAFVFASGAQSFTVKFVYFELRDREWGGAAKRIN
jgi:hypothetical protein